MIGTVGILNVGAGDTKLVIDNTKPDELARSAAIVLDMIRRGFVLLIEVGHDDKGPIYRRAHDFDESTAEYIIAGSAPDQEAIANEQEPAGEAGRGRPRKTATGPRRVAAATTNAVAVARTAGG